jgi:guanine deaminase
MRQSPMGFRGSIADLIDNPFHAAPESAVRYWADGLLVVDDGRIVAIDDYATIAEQYPELPIQDYSGQLILPGLIDLHIHFPQGEMIASYGEQLLEWLNRYTFPTEMKYRDPGYAAEMADRFLNELLKQGTTTALVFAAVFPESVEALFAAAQARHLCLIAGKVMMDRQAPEGLQDTAETSYQDSKRLIEAWHGRDRLHYAVTPRFAITSSSEQLRRAGQLLQEFPTVYLQTHLSENLDEVAFAKSLFPDCGNYLGIYDRANLVTNRSIFAHCLHLEDSEWNRLAESGSAIAFCPTSNLFLGSGLFDLKRAIDSSIPVGLGSDVGGGTSFSLLQTANEAYKVTQLQRQTLTPFQTLYLLTLGAARALKLDQNLGNFQPGKEADFIVLDGQATSTMQWRNGLATPQTLEELGDRLFGFWMLGDDRAVQATYILGQKVFA